MNPLDWFNSRIGQLSGAGAPGGNTLNVKVPNVRVKVPQAPSLPATPPPALHGSNPPFTKPGVGGLVGALTTGAAIGGWMEQNTPVNTSISGRGAGRAAFAQENPSKFADVRGSEIPGGMTPAKGTELGYGGYAKQAGPPSGLEGKPLPSSGVVVNDVVKTDGGGGVNTSATRPPRTDVTPTPKTVEGAYAIMSDPSVYGGRKLSDLNTDGFIDWSAFDDDKPTVTSGEYGDFSTMNPELLGTDSKKYIDQLGANPSTVSWAESPLKTGGDAFTTVDPTTSFTGDMVVRDKPKDAMAALRQNEKDQGLVYASGAYWMDGKDGLQKVTMGMTGDAGSGDIDKSNWTASRQQALNFMANRQTAGDVEGVKPAETPKSTVTAGNPPEETPISTNPILKDQPFPIKDTPILDTPQGPLWGGADKRVYDGARMWGNFS